MTQNITIFSEPSKIYGYYGYMKKCVTLCNYAMPTLPESYKEISMLHCVCVRKSHKNEDGDEK